MITSIRLRGNYRWKSYDFTFLIYITFLPETFHVLKLLQGSFLCQLNYFFNGSVSLLPKVTKNYTKLTEVVSN